MLPQDVIVALFFGFGLVSVSLLVSVLGILQNKYWLVIIGAVLFTPFSYYLFGASSASGFALLPLLFHFVSAAAVYANNRIWAWILWVPSLLVTLWVLSVAMVYGSR